ncbi:hypothetical protein DPMN_032178 [Dreissena polymorpha]|uniref:Uncharacterized protein n=1 Tax=Dreissena polymorpha TaxID=45954 RepID=A0A9D4M4H8_DREPO|nr:hypothetical protein DPMN_032178 [Dreissena polymorpha]
MTTLKKLFGVDEVIINLWAFKAPLLEAESSPRLLFHMFVVLKPMGGGGPSKSILMVLRSNEVISKRPSLIVTGAKIANPAGKFLKTTLENEHS